MFIFSIILLILLIPIVSAENVTIDNSTSIQNEITKINDSQIINLNSGIYKESGIEVNTDLTIQGTDSPEKVIIDGENKDSIIKVKDSKIKLTIRNITFINALNNENNGGAIQFYSTGHLIIDNCIFINNRVTTSSGEGLGGGIYAHGESNSYVELEVTNSKFLNNYAFTDGGAINTKFGKVTIKNCLFDNNSASRDGGAIGIRGLSDVDIYNCIFSNNFAEEWGGAVNNWLGKFTIDKCEFINNTVVNEGGAISNCGSLLKITNSTFVNNSARDDGGAIHSHYDSINLNVIANYNEFINNSASKGTSIFIFKNTIGTFNFENNYWGCNDPNWEEEFYTNDICPNPIVWLKSVNSTILANNLKRAYNSQYDFTATFLDKYGNVLKNSEVTFKLNNKNYTTKTDLNGVGKLILKLNIGTYSITCINQVTGEEINKQTEIVKRISGNKNINSYYLNGVYKIRIMGDDAKPVKSGEIVTFKIGKNIFKIKSDNNGYASLKLTAIPGNYNIFASYKGYSVKNNVKIKHTIKASSITKKRGNIKYSFNLISKNVKNKKITYEFKGKTYSTKTNSKGKATINLKNLKIGTYKITIKYVTESVKRSIKIK